VPEFASLGGVSAVRAVAGLLADPLRATRHLVDRHGPFVRIGFPAGLVKAPSVLHLARAELAEAVLKNHAIFRNGGIIVRGKSGGGGHHNALAKHYFNSRGIEHEHYSKLLGPHFRRACVDEMSGVIASTVREELGGWKSGELIDFTDHVGRLMKKLASRALHRDPDEQVALRAADMIEQHARLGAPTVTSVISGRFGHALNTAVHRQADRTYRAILDWAATRNGLPADRDLMSTIVHSRDEFGNPPSPDRVAGYGWIMLGAAYDTSASVLNWLIVLLALHPEVADRLYREIVGAPFDVETDLAATMELPYLDAVVREALRLVPPAPLQRRNATVDADICGCKVARGSQIFISAWMVNRDGERYPRPDRFDPDRWDGMKRSPFEWLTFSAGPRRCLGFWFAFAFLKATLANIVARWRPEIPGGTRIGMKVAVTVRPDPGLPVVLRPQDGAFSRAEIGGGFRDHLRLAE
jgi:cytochrome P450